MQNHRDQQRPWTAEEVTKLWDLVKSRTSSRTIGIRLGRSEDTVRQLRRLYVALCRLMQESAVRAWLLSPNDMLDGLKPVEVIDRGETDRLWNLLYQLETGTPM
jgi:hypothetical protein